MKKRSYVKMQNKNKRVESNIYFLKTKIHSRKAKVYFKYTTRNNRIYNREKNYDYRKLCEPQFEYVFKRRKTKEFEFNNPQVITVRLPSWNYIFILIKIFVFFFSFLATKSYLIF